MRVLTLIVALVICGCSKTSTEAASPAAAAAGTAAGSQATPAAPAKPVPAQIPDVVARVNGEAISKADFDRAVQNLEARAGGPVPPEQRDQVLRGVLDQVVGYTVLVQEGRARNVTVPDSEVDARIAQVRGQFPSEEEFTKMLAERKLTLDQVKSDVRRDLTITKLIDAEIASKIAVTPEQVNDFYAKNPDQFKQGESVRASHILISVPKGADAAAKAQARTQAETVLKDAKGGKDFAALAKEHSADPGSAANGGDLGFFQQGQMVGPFNDAAFTLPPGTISDLVETEFGFHIIKVIEKKEGRIIPLEEVKPQVEQYLERLNRQQQTDAFVNGLKAKGKIEILI
ncbi:MAG TPA: peptidylprolyl isomerase [Vicinamibacterales bacterium]|nr:peptidylprolyl isomerase [Vicinamibacterales bacterium]